MLPLCPRFLRTQWVNGSDGRMVIGCAPADIDDITEQNLQTERAKRILFGLAVFMCLMFCMMGIAEVKMKHREQNRRMGNGKKIAHAYEQNPYVPDTLENFIEKNM